MCSILLPFFVVASPIFKLVMTQKKESNFQ